MNKELLLPDTLTTQIEKRLTDLENTLNNLKESQKEMPHGHLRIAQKGDKRPCFYHYTYAISKIYEKLCPARQALITPVTLTHEQYIAQWKSVTWQGHSFSPDTPIYDTANKEQVLSKSEVIIAETLLRHGIPYRYEYPLVLKKGGFSLEHTDHKHAPSIKTIKLYPDFLCLNVHTRQEYIWEHFGLMDDPDYARNVAAKLRLYAKNGIFPGHNLIITMESKNDPLSTSTIDMTIKEYFT